MIKTQYEFRVSFTQNNRGTPIYRITLPIELAEAVRGGNDILGDFNLYESKEGGLFLRIELDQFESTQIIESSSLLLRALLNLPVSLITEEGILIEQLEKFGVFESRELMMTELRNLIKKKLIYMQNKRIYCYPPHKYLLGKDSK